jgi:hypothetical protein
MRVSQPSPDRARRCSCANCGSVYCQVVPAAQQRAMEQLTAFPHLPDLEGLSQLAPGSVTKLSQNFAPSVVESAGEN